MCYRQGKKNQLPKSVSGVTSSTESGSRGGNCSLMQEFGKYISERLANRMASLSLDASFQTVLPGFEQLGVIKENLPDWWLQNNNNLIAPSGIEIPSIIIHPGYPAPKDLIFVMRSRPGLQYIICWGNNSVLLLGSEVDLGGGVIACGPGSTIIIGDNTRCTHNSIVDARNGGLIYVGPNGLWASGVSIMTDDMHAIRDLETGRQVNAFGGNVVIGSHVWLGLNALVMDGAVVGHDVVVGARSVVTKPLNPNSIYAGVPARLIRNNITWAFEDEP